MNKIEFGERVRFLRKLENLTMQALAERVGITVLHLGNIERGTASPSFELINRLAEGLRTDPVNLFLSNRFPSHGQGNLRPGDSLVQLRKYVTRFGAWQYDPQTGQLHFSASMARVMGHGATPYTTTVPGFLDWVHQDDRPHMLAGWDRFRGGDYVHVDTFRFRRGDGFMRLGMIQGNADLDQDGAPIRFHGIALDITEQRQFEVAQATTFTKVENLVRERTRHLQDARKAAERESKNRATAEAEARKQERLFRELFENMHDGFLRFDENGRIVLVNKSTADTLGYPDPESMLGMSVLELYADPAEREAMLSKLLQLGRFTNQEFRFKRRDETHGWALVNAQILYDEKGQQVGSEVVFRDITTRVETEEQLGKALELLETTARIAEVGGWTYAPATEHLAWTAQTCRMHDLPPGCSLSLQEAIRAFHPHDQPLLTRSINQALALGTPYDLELRLITAKKRQRWVRTICQPEPRNGRVHLLRGIVQDITQRKEMEAQIRFSQERYELLGKYLQSRLVLFSHAASGKLLHVSEGVRLVSEHSPEQILTQGRTWENVASWTPESIQMAKEQQRRLLTGETDHVVFDMAFRHPTGWMGHLTLFGYFRWNAHQEIIFEGVAIDVTRQREMETQFLILQRVMDTVQVGVAILDARETILSINPALTRITGYPPGQAVGRSLRELVSEPDDDAYSRRLQDILASGQTWRGEVGLQRGDGSLIQSVATLAPFADKEGHVTHFILLLEDASVEELSQKTIPL